jgi:hypothetical protein
VVVVPRTPEDGACVSESTIGPDPESTGLTGALPGVETWIKVPPNRATLT